MEETEATAALVASAANIPVVEARDTHIPQCCCGRPQEECPFLARNNAALAGLERDVQTAARLGQVSRICQSSITCTCTLLC